MNEYIFIGYISEYIANRGFGFIVEEGKDEDSKIFFHISDVETKNMNIVPNRTEVTFMVRKSDKGLKATNIREHRPKIQGEFAKIDFPNISHYKNNDDRLSFLEEQNKKIEKLLKAFEKAGISLVKDKNGWLNLDTYKIEYIHNFDELGKNSTKVPNGYSKTFDHLMRLLKEQIDKFNYDLIKTKKGISGEEKTLNSLKSITLSYPVLKNVRLEKEIQYSGKKEKYSAETDLFVVTDRAIFLIETKNYGGKGDKIIITSDGRWILNKFDGKEQNLPNPFKQTTDHIFLMKKFLENHNFKTKLEVIPIVALANDDLMLEIEDKDSLYAKVMAVDLVGSFILKHLSEHTAVAKGKEIEDFKKLLEAENLQPKEYPVLDYLENIKSVCTALSKLINYFEEDFKEKEEKERKIKEEENREKEEEKEKERKANQLAHMVSGTIEIGTAIKDALEYIFCGF